MSTADAVRWCAARAGLRGGDDAPDAQPRLRPPPRRQMPERAPEAWPTLRPGTAAEKKALAALRGFSIGGIELAEARGLLHFGIYDAACPWRQHWKGAAFWAVTDAERRLVELRRMDGAALAGAGRHRAPQGAHDRPRQGSSLRPRGGGTASPSSALVEGAPDLIAAHDLLTQVGEPERVGVAAILGAGVSRLAAECLHHFKAQACASVSAPRRARSAGGAAVGGANQGGWRGGGGCLRPFRHHHAARHAGQRPGRPHQPASRLPAGEP
jgi:hypothetical protein